MAKIILDDPVLDANDEFTRLFLLAEYWKNKYVEARQALSQQSPATVEGESDQTYPFESALVELIDKIVPGLDSGDILADARTASKALDARGVALNDERSTFLQWVSRNCGPMSPMAEHFSWEAWKERALNQRLAVKEGEAVAWIHYDGEGRQRIGFGNGLVGLPEGTNLYTHPVSDDQQAKDAALELAVRKFLADNDPEDFGCACRPDGHVCGPCTWRKRFAPLYAALSATKQEEV